MKATDQISEMIRAESQGDKSGTKLQRTGKTIMQFGLDQIYAGGGSKLQKEDWTRFLNSKASTTTGYVV